MPRQVVAIRENYSESGDVWNCFPTIMLVREPVAGVRIDWRGFLKKRQTVPRSFMRLVGRQTEERLVKLIFERYLAACSRVRAFVL